MLVMHFSYESHHPNNLQKDTVRNKFANTILFVEDYLSQVRSAWSSKVRDRDSPKLTYQVEHLCAFLMKARQSTY